MPRFDEIELDAVPLGGEPLPDGSSDDTTSDTTPNDAAPRVRRLLALLTDLSLFAALTLALSPLLPPAAGWIPLTALGGFVFVLSYYYFVGTWMLWGKTIGGAIFDVKVVPSDGEAMSLRDATLRWTGVYLSLFTAGIGFALAALPSRSSLPDRLSATRCVAAQ